MSDEPARDEVVSAAGLVAGRDGLAVVHDLDLRVHGGEVVALVGPNGAGKSTTLLTIAGALPPMGGSVEILGEPVGAAHLMAQRGLAFVPEDRGLFHQLTAEQNLRLHCHRRHGDYDEVLGYLPALADRLTLRAGLLSGGEQQMLALAGALLARPRILMIDEMSLGLAPLVVAELLPLVRDMARRNDMGVLLVEQHVAAVLSIADRVYVLDRGRAIFTGTPAELDRDGTLLQSTYLGH